MNVLFDQGVPVPLRPFLIGHTVVTAFEPGWGKLQNGELLRAAEQAGDEILVTTDQNLKYQQNLLGRKIAIVVLLSVDWPKIQTRINACFRGEFDKAGKLFGSPDLKTRFQTPARPRLDTAENFADRDPLWRYQTARPISC